MTQLIVNGASVLVDADPETPLLWALRDHLGMTGTKFGCGAALCGACTVHVDGVAAGFLLMIDTPGDDYDAEIYLCGVAPDYRRRGIATQMIRSEALHMRQGAELAAACLPKAHAMKKLLAKLGFERDRNARSSAPGLRGPEWFRLLKR